MWNAILGFLGSLVGRQGAGAAVANGVTIVALAPLGIWFLGVKDDIAVSLTWGQIALFGAVLALVVKGVHRAPPPPPIHWRGGA